MKKTLFNDNFECKILSYDESLLDIGFGMDSKGYKSVIIPHDALIDDANSFYADRVIWYRKKIGCMPQDNKRLILYFDGVYMDASVYVGEQFVGRWVNGYTSFYFDITDYVKSAEDYIYVCIDHRCPNSRWYGGPGINRDVWLLESSVAHFTIDSFYVCPKLKNDNTWTLNIHADTENLPSDSEISVCFECKKLGISETIALGNSKDFTAAYEVEAPVLWNIDAPYTYEATVDLLINGVVTDTSTANFGFRNIEMSTETGLSLNGRHLKINGVCLHADYGCLGTAFYEDMAIRQLDLMKDMGVNAIRLAHNVQSPAFLDLCDKMGFLVLNEAFDCWKRPKTTYDYGRFFEEWSGKDIRSWIMRDRNHPCVFLWSAGNEIYDTHADEDGAKTLQYIADEIRKYDFFSAAPVTLCSNYMAWDNTINAVDFLKLAGYNYGEFLYEDHHKAHPDWVIFGSETASVVQSRGIYHFPLNQSLLVDDDEHCSSLGNACTSWGAKSMDFCVTTERDTPYSLGQFLWTGIDYLGEPTPYHTKSAYFGAADTACFPKDVYYMLQSSWRSFEECPMIHIFPYWDFNEGQIIDIRICSNAYEVELFFNEKSLGKKNINHKTDMCLYADYQLTYAPGILKAVGYDKAGNIAVTASECSFGDTAALKLSQNEFTVSEGDLGLKFVEIEAVDEAGNPVKNASDRIKVSVTGPGILFGLCNGNQTDMDSFKGDNMRLFSGKLLAVIKATGQAGQIKVDAAIDADNSYVRKLEITTDETRKLTPDKDCLEAKIAVHPAGASYERIEYQITNETGVPIQNAVIKDISEDGLTLTIQAVADANFNLRALCHESDGRVTVISNLEFVAEGFGELLKNPYDFVSGSLYDESNVEIGNGNDKGIATSRIEDTYILFKKLNFGPNGTRQVTIPIFELGGQEVLINFWKGMPHAEGSVCIGKHRYQKPSIWNVYQEETFDLDEILTGILDFGMEVISDKIHIKGFQFVPLNTTFDLHQVKDATNIYGDQFTIGDEMITGIGNNVCIMYKKMDFGATGATKIHITGYTPLPQNTIHIRLNDGKCENRQIIEFAHSEGVTTQSFDLEPFCGQGDLSFVFLPGSDFDFKDFRFESPED